VNIFGDDWAQIRFNVKKKIAKLPAEDRNKLLRQLKLAFASETGKQPVSG
jgi:hypothetical protein